MRPRAAMGARCHALLRARTVARGGDTEREQIHYWADHACPAPDKQAVAIRPQSKRVYCPTDKLSHFFSWPILRSYSKDIGVSAADMALADFR